MVSIRRVLGRRLMSKGRGVRSGSREWSQGLCPPSSPPSASLLTLTPPSGRGHQDALQHALLRPAILYVMEYGGAPGWRRSAREQTLPYSRGRRGDSGRALSLDLSFLVFCKVDKENREPLHPGVPLHSRTSSEQNNFFGSHCQFRIVPAGFPV